MYEERNNHLVYPVLQRERMFPDPLLVMGTERWHLRLPERRGHFGEPGGRYIGGRLVGRHFEFHGTVGDFAVYGRLPWAVPVFGKFCLGKRALEKGNCTLLR